MAVSCVEKQARALDWSSDSPTEHEERVCVTLFLCFCYISLSLPPGASSQYLFIRSYNVFGAPDIAFSARQRPPACCRGRSAWRLAAPWPVVAVLAAGDLPLTHNLMPAAVNAVLAALERREQRVSRGHSRGL